VDAVSQVFDPEDKALKARIVVDNADLKFKPGMSVEIRFHQMGEKPFVAIPADALIFDNNKDYAVVRKSENRFAIQEVELIDRNRGTAYIALGLKEGDEVVIKNQLLVYSELKGI
jgi:cobalt-zinc-cadmium efflux system membrane fusion protein